MSCIDRRLIPALCGVALIAACSTPVPRSADSVPAPAPPTAAARATSPPASVAPSSGARLAAPQAMRSWAEFRQQAALRLMAANPQGTYSGAVPDPLLAIPVLEVELNGDGSIRSIDVLRMPTQAKDTVQIAIDAMRRAGPFGSVERLPKPWKFAETFLFNDERKFKPRTLDP